MRVLHIIATADPEGGGPIEGILRMSSGLGEMGYKQELLTLDRPNAPFLKAFPLIVHALGASAPRTRFQRWARISPRAVLWARKHVRNYDAVIVNGLWNFATVVARSSLIGSGTPYIVYTHGMLDPWFKRRYPLKHAAKQLLWFFNEGPLINCADSVAFTCEEERVLARESFTPYRPRERVVQYGTNDPPSATSASRNAFASTVPLLKNRRYILFLSRIHEKKGCDLLVAAFAQIAISHHEIDLVIAGPDQIGLKHTLVSEAKRFGVAERIHWAGMLAGDAKWGAFHNCEAFILPSHQENFGIVVAEAMACGKPVLITDKVNIWREVAQSGGGFVAHDTIEGTRSLLDQFLVLSETERKAMGQRARECFLLNFDINCALLDVVKMLNCAINTKNANVYDETD